MKGEVSFSKNGPWKMFLYHTPPLYRNILVFRDEKKKYIIARAVPLRESCEKENDLHTHDWITQHNLAYPIDENDLWMEFPFVTTEVIYQ